MKMNLKFNKYILFFSIFFLCTNISTWWFNVIPVQELIQKHPEITYQKCFGKVAFNLNTFPLEPTYPTQGNFLEHFILYIPQGRVQSQYGFSIIDNNFIQELIWANQPNLLNLVQPIHQNQIIKIPGRVAVISQIAFHSYSHWLHEVLGRLAILEMHQVEYDWIYVPYYAPFMQETLQLWGIDPKKLIMPTAADFCVQADTLIIPSLTINTDVGFKHIGLYVHPLTMAYVKNKLTTAAQQQKITTQFSKRIFITRKDGARKITNEDEIFELFQQKGFVRYELSKISVAAQI